MKRRLRRPFFDVLKIVTILLLIVSIVTAGVFLWNYISKPTNDDYINPDADKIQTFEYSVNNYTLFNLEQFNFEFILADIHITSNKAINLSLTNFRTSENIQLNSVNTYLQEIEQAGYNFGDYKVVFGLTSETTELDALIFIPIIDRTLDFIDLDITLNPLKTLSFDLKNPSSIGTLDNLGINEVNVNAEDVATVTFERDTMIGPEQFYQLDSSGNRVSSSFSSQSQIYGIKITIENLNADKFRITKAFIHTSSGETYLAVDNTYLIDGIDNLNNIYIETKSTGYLFFEVLGQNITVDNFESLELYFSNLDDTTPYLLNFKGAQ